MAMGAVLAAALTDHSARKLGLYVNGLDVIRQPGASGNQVGVPTETIRVTEAGPGGVSEIEFTIEDPTATVAIGEGDAIRMHDFIADVPLFDGWAQSAAPSPLEGGQGRRIAVRGVGPEILLDWSIIPATLTLVAGVFPFQMTLSEAIQTVASAAVGVRDLRIFARKEAVGGDPSTQAMPIASFGSSSSGSVLAYDVVIAAGTSLREALRLVARASRRGLLTFHAGDAVNVVYTVDVWKGLRAMPGSGTWASDLAVTLTVVDAPGAALSADALSHLLDFTGVVRGVYVTGANAAGSGLVMDDSGLPGAIVAIRDATSDTAAKLADAATAYLAQMTTDERGSIALEDWTPTAGIHPGSLLALTDAAAGVSGSYRIFKIEKTFTGLRQTWRVTYGGLPPSAMAAVRRLTRDTLS